MSELNTNETTGGKLIDVEINKEMRSSFLAYSMSVITSRALPDVRDGLKPVHRRILYTMYENNLMPDKAYRKCADTVGTVLGRYHPHGDASVYDAMVRLAQDFSMRYMLVDGSGNFGSIDGDPAAAYRYTESRMSKISLEMLADIDKETVDFMPNYDDRLQEPTVLPAKFPNLLVNGSAGIAVGMATNIPPHNLRETCNAVKCLIENPEATLEDLMKHIKGPDFPTAGIIMGRSGIRQAYATGRGKITLRGRCEIVEGDNGRFKIVVSELPYQVNKARLIERIADLVKEKRIEGIADVNDYSNRYGINVVIDLKRDANPQLVLNQLYSGSDLQITFGIITIALDDGVPKVLTLRDVLQKYIDHQVDVIVRRTNFELKKASERSHILKALLHALDHIDEIIETLKASKNIQEGKIALMEKFGFDEVQATYVVQMRLGQLTGLENEKLNDEMQTLQEKIAYYNSLLDSPELVLGVIDDEITAIRDKYGDDRRTEIMNVSGEIDDEALIPEETCVFTRTAMGYLKRCNVDTYRQQGRAGRGIKAMTRREDDYAEAMLVCSTHDYIMFVTNKGKAYRLKGYEIPEGARTARGMNVINILPIESDERICASLILPEEIGEESLIMVTKNGLIKRTALDNFKNIRRNGIRALNILEGDELIGACVTNGDSEIIVATRDGMAVKFHETQAREQGRSSQGVRAIRLNEGDCVVGFGVVEEDKYILTVTENGLGNVANPEDYRLVSRGSKGVINYRTEKYDTKVAAVRMVGQDDDVILISDDGIIIRVSCKDIPGRSRASKGVRLMRLYEDAKVVAVADVEYDCDDEEQDEDTEQVIEQEEDQEDI
jgi:DNA gyrase subunit A